MTLKNVKIANEQEFFTKKVFHLFKDSQEGEEGNFKATFDSLKGPDGCSLGELLAIDEGVLGSCIFTFNKQIAEC